jgi:hypothetical protein
MVKLNSISSNLYVKRFYRTSAKAHLKVSPNLHEIIIGSMHTKNLAKRNFSSTSERYEKVDTNLSVKRKRLTVYFDVHAGEGGEGKKTGRK